MNRTATSFEGNVKPDSITIKKGRLSPYCGYDLYSWALADFGDNNPAGYNNNYNAKAECTVDIRDEAANADSIGFSSMHYCIGVGNIKNQIGLLGITAHRPILNSADSTVLLKWIPTTGANTGQDIIVGLKSDNTIDSLFISINAVEVATKVLTSNVTDSYCVLNVIINPLGTSSIVLYDERYDSPLVAWQDNNTVFTTANGRCSTNAVTLYGLNGSRMSAIDGINVSNSVEPLTQNVRVTGVIGNIGSTFTLSDSGVTKPPSTVIKSANFKVPPAEANNSIAGVTGVKIFIPQDADVNFTSPRTTAFTGATTVRTIGAPFIFLPYLNSWVARTGPKELKFINNDLVVFKTVSDYSKTNNNTYGLAALIGYIPFYNLILTLDASSASAASVAEYYLFDFTDTTSSVNRWGIVNKALVAVMDNTYWIGAIEEKRVLGSAINTALNNWCSAENAQTINSIASYKEFGDCCLNPNDNFVHIGHRCSGIQRHDAQLCSVLDVPTATIVYSRVAAPGAGTTYKLMSMFYNPARRTMCFIGGKGSWTYSIYEYIKNSYVLSEIASLSNTIAGNAVGFVRGFFNIYSKRYNCATYEAEMFLAYDCSTNTIIRRPLRQVNGFGNKFDSIRESPLLDNIDNSGGELTENAYILDFYSNNYFKLFDYSYIEQVPIRYSDVMTATTAVGNGATYPYPSVAVSELERALSVLTSSKNELALVSYTPGDSIVIKPATTSSTMAGAGLDKRRLVTAPYAINTQITTSGTGGQVKFATAPSSGSFGTSGTFKVATTTPSPQSCCQSAFKAPDGTAWSTTKLNETTIRIETI